MGISIGFIFLEIFYFFASFFPETFFGMGMVLDQKFSRIFSDRSIGFVSGRKVDFLLSIEEQQTGLFRYSLFFAPPFPALANPVSASHIYQTHGNQVWFYFFEIFLEILKIIIKSKIKDNYFPYLIDVKTYFHVINVFFYYFSL